MGWRSPLDLSEVLKDYEAFGGSPTASRRGLSAAEVEEERRRAQEAEERRLANPMVIGYGPLLASTCTTLVPHPLICWDVLGYYRTLGVHWKATKKELQKAFMALGPMPTPWQMNCLKQLLDPVIRREYDACPLGERFLNDDFVQDQIKAEHAEEASKRSARGTPTTAEEIAAERGMQYLPNKSDEDLDNNANNDDPPDQSPPTPWRFAYFTWRSRKADTDALAEWQSLIIREVSKRGGRLNFAVGFVGKQPHRYMVGRVSDLQVAFLSDKECPTEGLASAAAQALLNDMNRPSITS